MIFSNSFLQDLEMRGFLYQCTDSKAVDELFDGGKSFAFYVGFDPTAKSLHIGHLLWIRLVNKLQNIWKKPIVIAGGATGKIGDPTGKDALRSMLSLEEIQGNIDGIMSKLSALVDFSSHENHALLLNNDEWLSEINYLKFLRDCGPVFSVNRMLTMDSVKTRLEREQHLSFLEFNYMLLQAYDFLYLFEKYDCVMQIGGSDQWSNIISGVDLIKRKTGKQAFGLSIPLLTTSDGKKMGKTEGGTVWLDENQTSPFDFWQYWRNVDDKDVVRLLKLFTDIDVAEIDGYDKFVGTKEMNNIKIVLADAVTNFVHKSADLESIKQTAKNLFYGTDDFANDVVEFCIEDGSLVSDALVQSKLAESKTMAKKLIAGNGVKIDGFLVEDLSCKITKNCILSVGKKNFVKICII